MATYVVKSWRVSPSRPLDDTGTRVLITGRRAGAFAWLLEVAGVDPSFTLRADERAVYLETGSVFGVTQRMSLFSQMSAVSTAMARPIGTAATMLLLLAPSCTSALTVLASRLFATEEHFLGNPYQTPSPLGGVAGGLVGLLLAVAGVVVYYRYNSSVTLEITETSGVRPSVSFKRSMSDGLSIDEGAAAQLGSAFNQLLQAQQGVGGK